MEEKKLTSVKIKEMVNIKELDVELYCIQLNFGRKKEDRFKFPVIFSDKDKAYQVLEIYKSKIGYTLDCIKKETELIYDDFKNFHYNPTT